MKGREIDGGGGLQEVWSVVCYRIVRVLIDGVYSLLLALTGIWSMRFFMGYSR